MKETKYYILKPAVDTPETSSTYPAVESYDHYDFNAPNSVHKLTLREFPDFKPDIKFKLKSGAKLTDMLSQAAISAHGFLVSDKLKNIFSQLSIVPHKFYPAYIEDTQGALHNYYWMHIVWENFSIINWDKSHFFYAHYENKISLNFNSVSEYQNKKKELGMFTPIQVESLYLKFVDFDLFVHPLQALILLSHKGKATLQENNIKGVSIELL